MPQLRSLLIAVLLGVSLWPHGPEAQTTDLVAQARQALAADRIDEALGLLEKAVAANPNDPVALAELGSAQVRKAPKVPLFEQPGWVQKGFVTLDRAVERFPDAFVVYVMRGVTAAGVPPMFNKTGVALKDLTTVVTMKDRTPAAVPDAVMPIVYLNLGRAHKKSGQTAEARAAWETAKRIYPAAPEIPAIDQELGKL